MSAMKYISRTDRDEISTHGWYVRISHRRRRVGRFFSDRRHGGKDSALAKAVEWRDCTLAALGIPLTDRVVVTHLPKSATGIIGVSLRTYGGARRYYEVKYQIEPGRTRRRLFRIPEDEQGRRRALREAAEFRREREREMYGATVKANWAKCLSEVSQ